MINHANSSNRGWNGDEMGVTSRGTSSINLDVTKSANSAVSVKKDLDEKGLKRAENRREKTLMLDDDSCGKLLVKQIDTLMEDMTNNTKYNVSDRLMQLDDRSGSMAGANIEEDNITTFWKNLKKIIQSKIKNEVD